MNSLERLRQILNLGLIVDNNPRADTDLNDPRHPPNMENARLIAIFDDEGREYAEFVKYQGRRSGTDKFNYDRMVQILRLEGVSEDSIPRSGELKVDRHTLIVPGEGYYTFNMPSIIYSMNNRQEN